MSSFLDALGGVNWREYQFYLMDGNPPLYVQLLAVNGFFLALWFYRRIRAPHAVRQASAILLQAAFVLANVGVIVAGQMWS